MTSIKSKSMDITRLISYLKVDPNERNSSLLEQIFNEVHNFDFFKSLCQWGLKDLCVNVFCKHMTYIPIKKHQLDQNRDNIQILLEGQLNAYIPTPTNQDNDDTQPLKKKYVHTINSGQCVNIATVCFQKITSFYFDCSDFVSLLNIPATVNGISIIKQIQENVRADYDFIFEALNNIGQFYTQQQIRDILFVSRKYHFKKGSIQKKLNGIIVFIRQGEFSIFKDFSKVQKHQKKLNPFQQCSAKDNDTYCNEVSVNSEQEEEEEEAVENFQKEAHRKSGADPKELQKLKMQYKKNDSELYKRVRLGIKKPGSLILLSKKDNSVDGIECQEFNGVAFICTEEQYELITKEQERKSNATYSTTVSLSDFAKSENLIQNQDNQHKQSGKQHNADHHERRKSKRSTSIKTIVKKRQSLLQSQTKISKELVPQSDNQPELNQNNELNENMADIEHNSIGGSGKKDKTKGNMLRSKFELDYRKALINNIGQQLNTFGNFFYQKKKQLNNNQSQQNETQNQESDQKKKRNSKIATEKVGPQVSLTQKGGEVEKSKPKTEQDQEKLKDYLKFQHPQRRLQKKKTTTLINPLQQSQKNTLRGRGTNLRPQSAQGQLDLSAKTYSLTQREISDSPPDTSQNELARQPSITKIELNNNEPQQHKEIKFNRSKSVNQMPSTYLSFSTNNTPVHRQQIKNTNVSIESPGDGSNTKSKFQKYQSSSINNFTTQCTPLIELNAQHNIPQMHHHTVQHYSEYNFLSFNTNNDANTPSQVNSPSGTATTFSENYASIYSKNRLHKKSQHFIKSEETVSENNTPLNRQIQFKKQLEIQIKSTTPSKSGMIKYRVSENKGSESHRQFTSTTSNNGRDQNSTFNIGNGQNEYHFQKYNQLQAEQLPLTTKLGINSSLNLPTSKTTNNISASEISCIVQKKLESRVQSAKIPRVSSATINTNKDRNDQNIFKLNYDVPPNTNEGSTTNKDRLQHKNIMQILYPQKMKKMDQQTNQKTKQLSKEFNHAVKNIASPATTKSNKADNSVEQEFQLFLSKKLRPQSAMNRYKNENQITLLNKKVLDQFKQSINNTPSNYQNNNLLQQQQQQTQQSHITKNTPVSNSRNGTPSHFISFTSAIARNTPKINKK